MSAFNLNFSLPCKHNAEREDGVQRQEIKINAAVRKLKEKMYIFTDSQFRYSKINTIQYICLFGLLNNKNFIKTQKDILSEVLKLISQPSISPFAISLLQ